MVRIKQLTLASIVIFLCSCGLVYDRGHIVNEQYVPKKPNYDLKDKVNNVISPNLDTIGAYVAVDTIQNDIRRLFFFKFYPKGRVLNAQVWKSNFRVLEKEYEEISNSRDIYTKSGYYYSKDGKHIEIETFQSDYDWPMTGHYEKTSYYLSALGDTLTMLNPKSSFKMIYVKEKLPKVLEGYPVNW